MGKHMRRAAATASLIACALPACSTLHVKYDSNPALMGSVRCGSFAWAGSFHGNTPLRNTIANPLNESRLRAAIAAQLRTPIQAAPGSADCLIGYGIGGHYVVNDAWGYGYGWGPYYGWGGPGPYVYREGIISIDLYDARTRQPLWRASVDQSLFDAGGAEAEKRIDAAVAALFVKFPFRG